MSGGAQLTVCVVPSQSEEGGDDGMPMWFAEGSFDSTDALSRDISYLVCRGQRRFVVPSNGHVDCPGGDTQRDLLWRGIADAYQSPAATYSTVGSSGYYASYSHVVWVSSAHRSDASEVDPHYTTNIKQDVLSFAAYFHQLLAATSTVPAMKQSLFADVLTDSSGSMVRDFPKAQDGSVTSKPQRIVNLKHLESLFSIVMKRKTQNKGPRTTSIIVLTPVIFDILDWMASDDSAATPPPLLMFVFSPATSSSSHAASAAYTHTTLLNAVRPPPTVPPLLDRIHARGGISSLCVYLSQATRYACDLLVYVAQQHEESEGSAVPLSNMALVDMLYAQLDPSEVTLNANDLELALTSARLRITKLETLLNLKSNTPSESAVFTKLSDALFEVDVQREMRAALEVHVDHLQKQLAELHIHVDSPAGVAAAGDHADAVAPIGQPATAASVEVAPANVNVANVGPPVVMAMTESREQQTTAVPGSQSLNSRPPQAPRSVLTWSSLHPSAVDVANGRDVSASRSDSGTSSDTTSDVSSSEGSSSASSGASLSLDTFVEQARHERRMRALKNSIECGLSIGEVDDDLVSASDVIGPGSSTRVIKWGAHGHGGRREKWRRMHRSMRNALRRRSGMETVVPVADVFAFIHAAFDCAVPRHSDILNLVAHLHRHHLPTTLAGDTTSSRSASSDSEDDNHDGMDTRVVPWVNTRVALSALWNPCRDDVPKVLRIQFRNEPSALRVGSTLHVVVVLGGSTGSSVRAVRRANAAHPQFFSRVRWYRSYPTERNPSALHRVKEEQRDQALFCCEYRTSPDDIGSHLWCEVVPRDAASGRWGAAASVSTATTVSLTPQPPQLLHVRLLNHTRKDEAPVGQFVFVGDTVSLAYEIVSWPLEGRSRIRWLVCSALSRASHKRTLVGTHTPHRSIVVPASCAYHLLQVEVIPVQANGSQAGPTVTSLAVMVLPRPQTAHLLEARFSGPSAWSHSWRRQSLQSDPTLTAPMAVLPMPLSSDDVSSHGIHQVFVDITNQIETSVAISSGLESETADETQTDLVVAIAAWVEQAFAATETVHCLARSACGISIHHSTGIVFETTSTAARSSCWAPVPWDDVDVAENVVFPFTTGTHPSHRKPLVHLVVVSLRSPLVAATDSTSQEGPPPSSVTSVLVAFANATTAELFVLLVNMFRGLFQSDQRTANIKDGASAFPTIHTVKETLRLAASNATPLSIGHDSSVASLVDAASSLWLSLWMNGVSAPLPIEVKKSLKSIIFPLLATS